MRGATNQPPLIHLNSSSLTQQWWTICYLVLTSYRFKLSIHRILRINKHDGTQAKDNLRDHVQVRHQYNPLDQIRARLWRHQRNDATHLRQCGDPSDTTSRITAREYCQYFESNALHNPHKNGLDQRIQPGSIPHDAYEFHRGPTKTTPGSSWKRHII